MSDSLPIGLEDAVTPDQQQEGDQLLSASYGTTGYEIDPNGVNHPQHYNLHPAGIECIDVLSLIHI